MIDIGRKAATTAIRDARTRAGLTQEKAAALRGHATSTISRWESGGVPQTWNELHEYAKALGQPIVLTFGHQAQQNAAPDIPERLERIEGLVRSIAAATPGVKLPEVEKVSAELEPLVQPPGEPHQTEGSDIRGGSKV